MPTLGELKAQMRKEGVTDPAERNRRIADLVKSRSPRMTDVDIERMRSQPTPGQRMTDVDVERRRSAPAGGMQPRIGSPARERLTDVDVERMRNQPAPGPEMRPGRLTDMDIERQRQAAPLVLPALNVPRVEPQELTDEQVAQKWEPVEPELTGEQAAQRLTPLPEEQAESAFVNVLQQMADQYRTMPQYRQLLDQESDQLDDQISQLMQRRNMIQIAKRGG